VWVTRPLDLIGWESSGLPLHGGIHSPWVSMGEPDSGLGRWEEALCPWEQEMESVSVV